MSSGRRRAPVGVFDSGVGGLTVFEALRRRLPGEDLVYFGDTAHVPYGNKSPEAVARYAIDAARFLAGQGIQLLVVACNTASALALREIDAALDVPVIGVIGPGVRAASRATKTGIVGILATEATVSSGVYQRALMGCAPRIRSIAIACPLFVPLVEEGWWSHAVTRRVAEEYVRPLRKSRADSVILGCTHYPILKPVLRRVVGPGVRLIDSAEEVAAEVERVIASKGSVGARRASYRFYVSDGPSRFSRMALRLLGFKAKTVLVRSGDWQ